MGTKRLAQNLPSHKNTSSCRNLESAAEKIKNGGVVIFPTETVYGIGAAAFNAKACDKIFKIKNRPAENPLIVHIADIDMLRSVAKVVPLLAQKLIERFWPGPLTIVFKKTKRVPDVVTAGLGTVAVRMPSDKTALNLIRLSGTPLAAPSANISGFVSATDFNHIRNDFSKEKKIDYFLRGGKTKYGLESTIIDVTRKRPLILRPGAISVEIIEKILGVKVSIKKGVRKILAPGMYKSHYSPKTPLYVFDNANKIAQFVSKHRDKKIGILLNVKYLKAVRTNKNGKKNAFCLKTYKSIDEIAKKLYGYLRAFDSEKLDFIVAQRVSERGLGRAVNDRLRRAGSVF